MRLLRAGVMALALGGCGAAPDHAAAPPAAPAAEAPAHPLDGEWTVTLSTSGARGREVRGRFVIDPRFPRDPYDVRARSKLGVGRSRLDVRPLLGSSGGEALALAGALGAETLNEVTAELERNDTAVFVTIPRTIHGGLTLVGRLRGNRIAGRWCVRSFADGASGRFEMRRVPPTPLTDSLIARAVWVDSVERREYELSERRRLARIGYLRLRMLDRASGRRVAAGFLVEGYADNPGGWRGTLMQSAADGGWGEYGGLEPGRYDVVLSEFSCAGRTVFPDSATLARVPRVAVRIESRKRVSQEIALDLDAVARMSGTAATCGMMERNSS